jgi:hypothetical protein
MAIKVEVDWNKDGDYSDTSEDVTTFVRRAEQQISVSFGRDQSTALAPTVSGSGSFTLDNRDRRFSPRAATLANGTTNPLYGLIKPARPVRITRTLTGLSGAFLDIFTDLFGGGDATYTLFVGHTDENPLNPDPDLKTVGVAMVDSLADFRGLTISTGLYAGVRTGQAIGLILDACGWSSSLRDLDAGATVIPWFWCDQKDALTALEEIIRSEGPPALLTMGASGEVVFRDRHHRLTRSASYTSQGTWRSTGTLEPVMNRPGFSYDEGWGHIINTGTATVDVRTPQELQPVFTSEDTISLTAGESRLITVSATDPFFNAVPPVAGVDYVLTSGTVNTALTRTSGGSTTIIVTATTAAVVTGLQLRAQPVTVAYTVQVSAEDTASTADFGPRSFPGDLPWCNPYDADAVLTTTVAQRAQPLPIISARFMIGNSPIKVASILSRDLSDRVTVIEPETALNGDFYVENIAHQLTGTYDHEVTLGLEAVPQEITTVVFQLDTAGHGADNGKLDVGVGNSATILLLDSAGAGHLLDAGLLAA